MTGVRVPADYPVVASPLLRGREDELTLIGEIGQVMRDASICGLGQLAANAVDSAVNRLKLFEGAASLRSPLWRRRNASSR